MRKLSKRFYVGITSFFFLLLPLFSAHAVVAGALETALSWFFIKIVSIFYWFARLITLFFNDMLQFVLSEDFIQWPYTRPGESPDGNPIIEAGLSVTLPLVNVIIIFALIVIAGGIILGLEKYGTKKMLFSLVLVALLVNFSPLLVGLVVDAANIAMYFFVQEAQDSLKHVYSTIQGGGEVVTEQEGENKLDQNTYQALAFIVMQTFVTFIMGFIFFLYMLLFIFRYIAIWMLTILSPLAFACLAHPLLNEWWKKWWSQTIQWSIVGVTGAFFIFLSSKINEQAAELYDTQDMGGTGEGFSRFASEIATVTFPMFVVAAFFVMGYILAITTSAMGADKVVNFAQERRKWAQKQAMRAPRYAKDWSKDKASKGARKGAAYVSDKTGLTKKAGEVATAQRWGEGQAGFGGWAKRRASVVQGAWRAPASKIAGAAEKQPGKMVKDAEKKYEHIENKTEMASKLSGARNEEDRLAIIKQAKEKGMLKDVMEKSGDSARKNFEGIYGLAEKTGDDKTIKKALPMEYIAKKSRQNISQIGEKKHNENIKEVSRELGKDPEALKSASDSIAKAIEKEGPERDEAEKIIQNLMQEKASVLQTMVDSSDKAREALYKTAERHAETAEKELQEFFGKSFNHKKLNREQKLYALMKQKRAPALRAMERGMADIAIPYEHIPESSQETEGSSQSPSQSPSQSSSQESNIITDHPDINRHKKF